MEIALVSRVFECLAKHNILQYALKASFLHAVDIR